MILFLGHSDRVGSSDSWVIGLAHSGSTAFNKWIYFGHKALQVHSHSLVHFFKDRTATLSFKQVTSVIQISIKGWFTVKNKKTKQKTWKKTVQGNDLARLFNSPTLKILGLLVLYATTLPLSNICYLEVSLQGTVHLLHFLRGYSRGCSRAMTLLHNIGHLLCGSKQNKWEILKATIKKNNN